MMRVYVSGPMAGLPEKNFPEFHRVADKLRQRGYDVVNPADLEIEGEPSWEDYIRRDLKELLTCDAIALLTGWEHSRGATLECFVGTQVGMEARHWLEWM